MEKSSLRTLEIAGPYWVWDILDPNREYDSYWLWGHSNSKSSDIEVVLNGKDFSIKHKSKNAKRTAVYILNWTDDVGKNGALA